MFANAYRAQHNSLRDVFAPRLVHQTERRRGPEKPQCDQQPTVYGMIARDLGAVLTLVGRGPARATGQALTALRRTTQRRALLANAADTADSLAEVAAPLAAEGAALDALMAPTGQLRLTERMLDNRYKGTRRRGGREDTTTRGTRGRGIRVLGGQQLHDSSIHNLARLRGGAPFTRTGDRTTRNQLYEYLVAKGTQEPVWLTLYQGAAPLRTVHFEAGAISPALLHMLCVDAVAMDHRIHVQSIRMRVEQEKRAYRAMWEEYYLTETRQLGLTLYQRLTLRIGEMQIWAGLSVSRPPEA